MIQLVPFIMFE